MEVNLLQKEQMENQLEESCIENEYESFVEDYTMGQIGLQLEALGNPDEYS